MAPNLSHLELRNIYRAAAVSSRITILFRNFGYFVFASVITPSNFKSSANELAVPFGGVMAHNEFITLCVRIEYQHD